MGHAAPQRHRLRAPRGLELLRDLQQITHDDLVIGGGAALVGVDRLCDHRRLSRHGLVVLGLQGQRRPREADPELRGPRPFCGCALADELEALVGEGVQLDVGPGAQPLGVAEAQRLPGALRVHGQGLEHVSHFRRLDTLAEGHGTQVVPMQPLGELAQHRMLRVGGDPLDDKLPAGDAQRQGRAVLEQQRRSPGHARSRRRQRRVALGIHGVLVEGDGQLDQEIGEVARQGRAPGTIRGRGRCAHG